MQNTRFPGNGDGTTYFGVPASPVGTGGNYAPAPPQLPGVGRNTFTGPGYQDLDGTIAKNFGLPRVPGLGESAGLEIRADLFNVLNQTNLVPGSVDTDISSKTFGLARNGLAGRVINLQARFNF